MPPFPPENTPLSNPATEPTNQLIPPPVRQMANLNYSVPHLPTHLLRFGFPLCLKKKKKKKINPANNKNLPPTASKTNTPPSKKRKKKKSNHHHKKKKMLNLFLLSFHPNWNSAFFWPDPLLKLVISWKVQLECNQVWKQRVMIRALRN